MTIDNSMLAASISGLTINLNGTGTVGSSGVVALNGGQGTFDTLIVQGSTAASGVLAQGAGAHVTLTGAGVITSVADSPNYSTLASPDFLSTPTTGFSASGSAPPHGLAARDAAIIDSTGTRVTASQQFGAGVYALRGG